MSSNHEKINLKIGAGVLFQNNFFFSEYHTNSFYKMDLDTSEIHFLKMFQKEEGWSQLYRDAYLHGHKMWLIPWNAFYIVKVDLLSLEMTYYDIPNQGNNGLNRQPLAVTGLFQDRYIYAGFNEETIVLCIDMEKEEVIPYNGVWEDKIKVGEIIFENKIWIMPKKGQGDFRLCSIDLETQEKRFWDVQDGVSPNWRSVGMRKISSQGNLLITSAGYLNIFDSKINKFRNYQLWIDRKRLAEEIEREVSESKYILKSFKGNGNQVSEEYILLKGLLKVLPEYHSEGIETDDVGNRIFEVLRHD